MYTTYCIFEKLEVPFNESLLAVKLVCAPPGVRGWIFLLPVSYKISGTLSNLKSKKKIFIIKSSNEYAAKVKFIRTFFKNSDISARGIVTQISRRITLSDSSIWRIPIYNQVTYFSVIHLGMDGQRLNGETLAVDSTPSLDLWAPGQNKADLNTGNTQSYDLKRFLASDTFWTIYHLLTPRFVD